MTTIRAIADYDEAIRLDPEDPDTYRNRGLAFYHTEANTTGRSPMMTGRSS